MVSNDKPQPTENTAETIIGAQAQDQTGQKRVRVRVDESKLQTSYASAFHPNITAEEVMINFGMNFVRPSNEEGIQHEVLFQANNRIIMNYYCAKRLAIALGNVVQRYEKQFGTLELNEAKRRVAQPEEKE